MENEKPDKTRAPKKDKNPETSQARLKAVVAYRPRIKQGRTGKMQEIIPYIASRTPLNEGSIFLALKELRDTMLFFLKSGRPVKMDDIGTFSMDISKDGTMNVKFRPDPELKRTINAPKWFAGEIINRDMIDKSTDELAERWNEEHPDDPIG